MSWLDDARSSAGAFPTTRLLQGRWVRRGRTSHLRSLLIRRHVDEDDEDLARVNTGSGSHNLDAPPTWRAKDVGENCLHEHLWGPSPFSVRRGAEVARRADRGEAHEGFTQLRAVRMRKTLLLLCGLDCVLAREC